MNPNADIEEERRRARRLRICHDLTRTIIQQGTLELVEALQLCAALRVTALSLFPDCERAFDLIYKPRLKRDIQETYVSSICLN